MRSKLQITIFISLFLTLISCEKNKTDKPSTPDGSIYFDINIPDKANFNTRGASFTNDLGNTPIISMKIFCYITGNSYFSANDHTPNWMYNTHVSREGTGEWDIILEEDSEDVISNDRWAVGNNHSFFAFAPYTITGGVINKKIGTTGTPEITYSIPNNRVDTHIDLLYASHLNTQDISKAVNMAFNHALAKVYFTIKMENTITFKHKEKVRIHGISLENIWNTGKLKFKREGNVTDKNAGNSNEYTKIEWHLEPDQNNNIEIWSDVRGGDLTHLRQMVFANNEAAITPEEQIVTSIPIIKDENALFMIPQPLVTQSPSVAGNPTPNNPRLIIAYHHYLDQGANEDAVDILKEYPIYMPENWQAGKAYNYTITYDPNDGDAPFSIKASITDWTTKEILEEVVGGYLNLKKREYNKQDATGIAPNRVIKIPFETNYPVIQISGNKYGEVEVNYKTKEIIYTETKYNPTAIADVINITAGKIQYKININLL